MDGEIMEVIDAEVRRLPKRKRKKSERYQQYEDAKKRFRIVFPHGNLNTFAGP